MTQKRRNFQRTKINDMKKTGQDTSKTQPNNPLHGVKLVAILEYLVATYGWDKLGEKIDIRCFKSNPSINSSLKFLRTTPWARAKVEDLYLRSIK